jgi:RNA polymerase sigma factor (sigma-70 family)
MRTDSYAGWDTVLEGQREVLVRTASTRLGRAADAEDVVHDVLLRIFRAGRSTQDVGAPVAYLRRAVANECVDKWRRTRPEVLVDQLPERHTDGAADRCVERLVLVDALTALPDQQRRVVTLTILEDWADAEAAELLGVSPVTVRTTRRRALAKLRAEFSTAAAA